jgi:CHAT domain-containing protein
MLLNAQFTPDSSARATTHVTKLDVRVSHPAIAYSCLCAIALLLLMPLLDTHPPDPAREYAQAWHLFESGHLAASRTQAAIGYERYARTKREWAPKFLLLEAETMIWLGMNEDALRLLSDHPLALDSPDQTIQALSLESVALAHLQRFAAAEQKLEKSQGLCAGKAESRCGGVLRAAGILSLERGNFADAKDSFLQALNSARSQHDQLLETTVLLYLGVVSLQHERYDEAMDWSRSAYQLAASSGEEDLAQVASGNLGWALFKLGDRDRALELLTEAQKRAAMLGDVLVENRWLVTTGYIYMDSGKLPLARNAYLRALKLAQQINSKGDIAGILVDLAQVAVAAGNADEADSYAKQALALAQESGSRDDQCDVLAIQLQAAALRGDRTRAEALLHDVETAPESQTSMKWASEHALAKLYDDRGETAAALSAYHSALHTFESARAEIQNEDSRLPFLANATRIYDDYIHFLVKQGKTDEALAAADQSRARTLAQGLGVDSNKPSLQPTAWRGTDIARKTGATVLFYWLGEKQSYLWAINAKKTTLFALPAQSVIAPLIERYRKAILGPSVAGNSVRQEAVDLYRMLVEPAASLIGANSNVVVVSDGPLSLLNFETLVVPGTGSGTGSGSGPHYWIEDANVVSAPSLYLLASRNAWRSAAGKLLLLGDAVSPNPDYPDLPMAAVEMRQIEKHFGAQDETVFARQSATSGAYLNTPLQQYSYIHFVAHGVASRTDPLDSAIILSRTGAAEDSFKLHAREIIQHPIDARLVTISACYGGGTRSYAGEGLVGLSWAFLRAGAHNVIGALWEASDDSTPQLMDSLYQGLEQGMTPSAALRQAKLTLMHSQARFSQPFYWAPFQIYTGM